VGGGTGCEFYNGWACRSSLACAQLPACANTRPLALTKTTQMLANRWAKTSNGSHMPWPNAQSRSKGLEGEVWGARTFFCPLALLSVVLRGQRGQWLQGSGEHGGSAQASDTQGERRKTRERCAYRGTASGVSSSELAAPPPPPSSAITSWVGRLEFVPAASNPGEDK
jgi:hypothetical protein